MAAENLQRTCASNGSLTKWTASIWVKRSDPTRGASFDYQTIIAAGPTAGGGNEGLFFNTGDSGLYMAINGNSFTTPALFRDPTHWYHIVVGVDTTQATASNRLRAWVNGVEYPWNSYPTQNLTFVSMNVASGQYQRIGYHTSNSYILNGSIADVYFVDGQQLTASAFGQTDATTGQWIPLGPATVRSNVGSFGTNGYYLPFKNKTSTTTLGYDYKTADRSSNNDWTLNNLTVADAVVDGIGNSFMQMQTAATDGRNAVLSVTNGGTYLHLEGNNTTDSIVLSNTAIPKTGKWYFEVKPITQTAIYGEFGIANIDRSPILNSGYNNSWLGENVMNGHALWYWTQASGGGSNGGVWDGQFSGRSRLAADGSGAAGQIIQVFVDRDNAKIYWSKNGSPLWGDASASSGGSTIPNNTDDWVVATSFWNSSGYCELEFNFGQGTFVSSNSGAGYTDSNGKGKFQYQPPTGYLALCEDNYPTPAVTRPPLNFKAITWSGDGSTSRSFTGLGFKPDIVWIKTRSGTDEGYYHRFAAIPLGSTSGYLSTHSQDGTQGSINGYVSSYDSDGFTIGNGTSGGVNTSGSTYVAWCWKMSSGNAVSNTDGTITSTVWANPTAGQSLVAWTGVGGGGTKTVGHGLGKTPSFIMVKDYSNGGTNWVVWSKYFDSTSVLQILSGAASNGSISNYWGSSLPTSTVFGVEPSGSYDSNQGGHSMMAVVFADVPGYSKSGQYKANNSTDNTYVYTGFKPAFVLIKNTDNAENWYIFDNARNTYNSNSISLQRASATGSDSAANTQATGTYIDFTSSGFKIRDSSPSTGELSYINRNYIYIAFAERPWQFGNAV